MTGVDLGTWFVRVVLDDGRGFIMKWNTGSRWFPNRPWSGNVVPLDSTRQPPTFADEDRLLSAMRYMFIDGGNYSCDCNLHSFLQDAEYLPEECRSSMPCGDWLKIARLHAIRPDGSEVNLFEVDP